MAEEPPGVADALADAAAAFEQPPGGFEFGQRLDPSGTDADVVQLQTACRLLAACRTLREPGGYAASVCRLSFAAIDRSVESYAFARDESVGDLRVGRAVGYQRAAERGLLGEDTADRIEALHEAYRAVVTSCNAVPSPTQAATLFELATAIHDHIAEAAERSHECQCG